MKKLIKLALLVGAVTVAARLISAKKQEWEGLSEEQVRSKIEGKFPGRVPDEKRQAVADKVVGRMKARGKLAGS